MLNMLKSIINWIKSFFNGINELSCGSPEVGAVIILVPIIIIALIGYTIKELIYPTPPKPKPTPEQIQEIREEKYNKTGKAVHEFLRGVTGKDKSEKK